MMNEQKKIMFLGANIVQTPVIKLAKKLGYTAISCDYLPDNPGHKFSDKYINVSTIDMDAVLKVAQQENIDGIISFASDVSAPTAAYVAEQMGLSGHPLESVDILTHKDKFRKFLLENDFPCPQSKGYDDINEAESDWKDFNGKLIVKPVDSSGSKGVALIQSSAELRIAAEAALEYSRSKRFIVETFVEMEGCQIIGDGFSVNGRLVFSFYGDHLFNEVSGGKFAVQGGSFPLDCSLRGSDLKDRVDSEVQRVLTLLNMKSGAYNIEARLGKDGKIYIMEVGPRNGGNMIPELIHYATGVDLTYYTIMAAIGDGCKDLSQKGSEGFYAYYVIHSGTDGIFDGLQIEPEFREKNLLEYTLQVETGSNITRFSNAAAALGVALCKFSSRQEMESKMKQIEDLIKVKVR